MNYETLENYESLNFPNQSYTLILTDENTSPSDIELRPLEQDSIEPSDKTLSYVTWARLQLCPLGETSYRITPKETIIHSGKEFR